MSESLPFTEGDRRRTDYSSMWEPDEQQLWDSPEPAEPFLDLGGKDSQTVEDNNNEGTN